MLKFFFMLIFPKPLKVPASCLVWTYPRALAFIIYKKKKKKKHVPGSGLAPGWGQRSVSRMMLILKFWLKLFLILSRLV